MDPFLSPDAPVDPIALELAAEEKARIQTGLATAQKENPDKHAQALELSAKTSLPLPVVKRNQDDVIAQQMAAENAQLLSQSPVAQSFMQDPDNAAIAHDDVPGLIKISQALEGWGIPSWHWLGLDRAEAALEDLVGGPPTPEKSLSAGRALVAGVEGIAKIPFVLDRQAHELIGQSLFPDNPYIDQEVQRDIAASEGIQRAQDITRGDISKYSPAYQSILGGLGNFGSNLPGLAASVITLNPLPALALSGLTAETQGYEEGRNAGASPLKSTVYGLAQGGVEVATEFIPVVDLFKDLKVGSPLLTILGKQLIEENVGEQVATAFQDLNSWLFLHPEKTFQDYLSERPNAALETAVQTTVGTLLSVGTAAGANIYLNHDKRKVEESKVFTDGAKEAAKQIQALPATQRAPDRIEDFVAQKLQEQRVEEVWVDGEALALKTLDSPELANALGVDVGKMADAATAGADVRLTAKQFATLLTRPEMADLLDHIKPTADGVTATEAQTLKSGLVAEAKAKLAETPPEGEAPKDARTAAEKEANPSIDIAAHELGVDGLFKTAAEAGLTPSGYASYLAALANAKDAAYVNQQKRFLKEEVRRQSDEWRRHYEDVQQQVTEHVDQMRVYQAINSVQAARMDRAAVAAAIPSYLGYNHKDGVNKQVSGEDQLDLLPKQGKRTIFTGKNEKGGVHPEVVAQNHGYKNATEMLLDMMTSPKREDVIKDAVGRTMDRQFGNLKNQIDANRAALETLHSGEYERVIATELNQLRAARKQGRLKPKLLHIVARQIMESHAVKDIKPDRYVAAERKWAKAAAKALRAGDIAEAADAKFKQLLNFQMARESYKAQARIAKEAKTLQKFLRPRKAWRTIDADYIDRIRELLANVKFGPEMSESQRKKLAAIAFADAVDKFQKDHGSVFIPTHPKLVAEDADQRLSYRNLPLSAWNKMYSDAMNLLEQGRKAKEVLLAGRKQNLDDAADELVNAAQHLPTTSRTERANNRAPGYLDPAVHWLANADAWLVHMSAMLRQLDGKDLGEWVRHFYHPVTDAQHDQSKLIKDNFIPVLKKLEGVPKQAKAFMSQRVRVGGLGQTFTGSQLFMMALNAGNESNLAKMLEGSAKDIRGGQQWTREGVDEAINHIPDEVLSVVQDVWDTFEKLYPEIEKIYREEAGRSPEKIEPREVKTISGKTLKGGYFPMIYDMENALKDRVKTDPDDPLAAMKAEHVTASVFNGMTKDRTGFSAPVQLDIARLPREMDRLAHYITHYAMVRDTTKLINNSKVKAVIRDKLGPEYYNALKNWLGAIAKGGMEAGPSGPANQAFEWVRSNMTAAVLGLSYTTLVSQTLGLSSTVAQLGGGDGKSFSSVKGLKYTLIGLGKYLAHPGKTTAAAFAKSKELPTRLQSVDRDIKATLDRVTAKPGVKANFQRAALLAVGAMQLYTVDLPTWTAAYNKAITEGRSEDDASRYADGVLVQSQGSGHLKDQNQLQRDRGAGRLVTMFSTYLMTLYNQERTTLKNNRLKDAPSAVAKMVWLVVIPAILQSLLSGAGPDDDEDPKVWWAKRVLSYGVSAVPVAGTMIGAQLNGYTPQITPLERTAEAVGLAASAVWKGVFSDEELSPAGMRNILQGAGLAVGLPGTTQLIRVLRALEDEDANVWDYLRGPNE